MVKELDIFFLAEEAFCTEIGTQGKPFGSKSTPYRGRSDGNEGVQWNIWEDKNSELIWIGVNLEGKKYNNWPIVDFIKNELRDSDLINIAQNINDPSIIWIGLHRDAWQVTYRPPIKESNIGDGEVKLSDMTEKKWRKMLTEALSCLNKEKNYRGRAKQRVTLTNGKVREMEVSPHLNIHTQVPITDTVSGSDVKALVKKSMNLLIPFYNYVNECVSRDSYINS